MAKHLRLTEEDTLELLFLNNDEDVSNEDKEMEFELDTSDNCSESSNEHLIFDEDSMDVDNISHHDDGDANVITSNVTGSIWKRYDSTDRDLVSMSATLE